MIRMSPLLIRDSLDGKCVEWLKKDGIKSMSIEKGGETMAKLDMGIENDASKSEAYFTAENMDKAKSIDDTGSMAWGDYTFRITVDNMLNIETLFKYAQMLDFVIGSRDKFKLNMDGVVNEVLDEAVSKRVKALAKKHGFESTGDFIESICECKDGEEVSNAIKQAEHLAYVRAHNKILSLVPLYD